jgi:serine phosphatase RsbU (regulator of sigma subunit)
MSDTKIPNVTGFPTSDVRMRADGNQISAVSETRGRTPHINHESHLRTGVSAGYDSFQKPSSWEDRTILGSLASHSSISLASLRKAKNSLARGVAKRRADEMAIAREVQRKLFPQHLPSLATLDYAGNCEPAWTVGGDYYDFLEKSKGRVGFVLADVSGKGVAAALLMANLQANIRSQYVVAHEDLAVLFRSVNKLFYESVMLGFFATLFFAEYFDTTRELRYVNCGHCPAFLFHADGTREKLNATATVLGMFESWDCAVGQATISFGDILVVYSDGVTEAQSGSGELFGEDGLLAAVQANASLPAAGLLKAIAEAARSFGGNEHQDDLTLLVARAC